MIRAAFWSQDFSIIGIIFLSVAVIRAAARENKPDGSRQNVNNNDYFAIWKDFKNTYNKSYETSEEEEARFRVFIDNHRTIEAHNQKYEAGRKSFRLAVNKYADMTNEEFSSKMTGYKPSPRDRPGAPRGSTFLKPHNIGLLPDEIDWRGEGYVTPVKDQTTKCGSCWAFSAVGSLEGQHYRKTGILVQLSEQNLIDCSAPFGSTGCAGGWVDGAFNYIQANDGIDTEASYPYEAKNASCRFKKECVGAEDTGYVDIMSGDEGDLEVALATVGPVSVAIDSNHSSFHLYGGGLYDEPDCSPEVLDHAVVAVGYGVTKETEKEEAKKYYLIKNSWGPEWGEAGYIRMSRRKDNQCGIATHASYPLV